MLLLALKTGSPGGGDIKLVAACGLFLGIDALLYGVLLACALALAALLLRCLCAHRGHISPGQHPQKRAFLRNTFAFGPYLAAGFILMALAG